MEKDFYYQSFKIRYSDVGQDIPVILLHGFGEDSRIWDRQVSFLSPHCRLIVPDLPGSGGSVPIGPDIKAQIEMGIPASIDSMAESIAALLENENIPSVILLGHSMGGYIALAFGEKYPEKLLALGLIHSTAFADSEEKKATRRKAIEFVEKNGAYAFLQTAIPGLFGEAFNELQPATIAAQVAQFAPANSNKIVVDAATVAYYQAMIARPNRTAVLESNERPVLFIIGTDDKAVPMEDVLKQVPLAAVSYVHILQQTGHMSMLEKTDELNKHLLGFITDVNEKLNKL